MLNCLNLCFCCTFIRQRLSPASILDMLIPANAVGKVLGRGGANVANIRKVGSHNLEFINRLFYYKNNSFLF